MPQEADSGRVDLHVHTSFSDSDLTPENLVEAYSRSGLRGVAVTDHDTVGGVEAVIKAAEGTDLIIIPGVELSATDGQADIHILGYFVDHRDTTLQEKLERFAGAREERARKMLKRLEELGVDLPMSTVLEVAAGGVIGRPHVAEALRWHGFVGTNQEAFQRFIGYHSPAYVPKFVLSPEEAISIVVEAGGVAVLAHPGTVRRDELIPEMMDAGLGGLEVIHPKHDDATVERYAQLARELRLVPTGGSDWHGSRGPDSNFTAYAVPIEIVDALRAARGNADLPRG